MAIRNVQKKRDPIFDLPRVLCMNCQKCEALEYGLGYCTDTHVKMISPMKDLRICIYYLPCDEKDRPR